MANPPPKKQPNPYVRFISAGFQMGATIWLGNVLGQWIDKHCNLDIWESILTLFAVFVAMYLVINQVLKLSKDND